MSNEDKLYEAFTSYLENGSYAKAGKKLGIDQRTVKKRVEKYQSIYSHATQVAGDAGIDPKKVAYFWYKTDDMSMFVRNNVVPSYDEIRENFIAEMKKYSPSYNKIEHVNDGEYLLVVDPADIHIGKLSRKDETGFEYDQQIALTRVREGVSKTLEKAKGFGISKIILVVGNDALHIDHPHRKTTAGTPQDTDGMWWESFLLAKKCYIAIIEELTTVADVHVVYCPSNHDYSSGFMLADSISSWFHKHPNVHFGIDNKSVSINHRKYVQYGSNLIGFTHGDGAKEKDLPSLMQFEARKEWGESKFGYWYVHHTHHKNRSSIGLNTQKLEKDHIGVTVLQSGKNINSDVNIYVETVRTPSPSDAWHSRNGYVNQQAIEAFLHHPTDGQVARFTHWF